MEEASEGQKHKQTWASSGKFPVGGRGGANISVFPGG